MKKYQFIILSTIFLVSIYGCGKYEEGPSFSLIPKKYRIAGIWMPEKLLFNGQENQFGFNLIKDLKLTLNPDGTGEMFLWNNTADVEWKFSDNKDFFLIRHNYAGNWSEWSESEIIRLTMKEFWVREKDNNDIIETYYIKK